MEPIRTRPSSPHPEEQLSHPFPHFSWQTSRRPPHLGPLPSPLCESCPHNENAILNDIPPPQDESFKTRRQDDLCQPLLTGFIPGRQATNDRRKMLLHPMSALFQGARMHHQKQRYTDGYVLYPLRSRPPTHLSTFLSFFPLPSSVQWPNSPSQFPPPAGGATSVTVEQTQARLEEFRQMPWLEPDWEDATP
jgi:hypothetical protein